MKTEGYGYYSRKNGNEKPACSVSEAGKKEAMITRFLFSETFGVLVRLIQLAQLVRGILPMYTRVRNQDVNLSCIFLHGWTLY